VTVASTEALHLVGQDTNNILPHINNIQNSGSVGDELPTEPFELTRFEFHPASMQAALAVQNPQRQEGLLAEIAHKSHFKYALQDWWRRDPRMDQVLQANLGKDGEALYRGVVAHFPEISAVQHRASTVVNAARICIDETDQPETILSFLDNGSVTASADELTQRWVKPSSLPPTRYDSAAQQLAHAVATEFGGTVIAASGDHQIHISGVGKDYLHVERQLAAPLLGNLVVVRLPHIVAEQDYYPPLRLVPALAPELEAV